MAELSGQGPMAQPQATSVATTDAVVTLGHRARDTDGNEYIYVSYGETLRAGQWVRISGSGAATRLSTTSRGRVGIVMCDVTSADNGWVQIYGSYATAQIQSDSSEASSIYHLASPSGASTEAYAAATSLSSLATNHIFNAWISGDASTATTLSSSAHSGVTVAVHLNYPFVTGVTISENTTVGSS